MLTIFCSLGGAGGSDPIREILPNLRDFFPNLNGSIILNRYLKMQTEHLKYVDLVDLHHRFLVQISRQIAPGFAWRLISLTNLELVTGKFLNDLLFVRRGRWVGSNS